MTTLDIAILTVFVGSAAIGFRKGIVKQIGSLGGIVAGVIICRIGGTWLTGMIADNPEAPEYTDSILAKVILFLAGYISVRCIAHFLRQVTRALRAEALDRIAGAVFSIFQWMLVMSLLLNLWLIIKPATDFCAMSTLANGHAINAILSLAPAVMGWASETFTT